MFDPSNPAHAVEWSVSITDDDQRTMTAADIAAEYRRGTLDLDDTFVWRDGMGDWVPLGHSHELMAVINQVSQPAAPAPAYGGYPDPSGAYRAPAPVGYADPSGSYAAHGAYAPDPYPADPSAGFSPGEATMMINHEEIGGPNDPYRQAGAGNIQHLPAGTNPQAVAAPAAAALPTPPRRKRPPETPLFEAPRHDGYPPPRAEPDLLSLGSGAGIAASSFAPPDLLAAPPPPPPAPPEPEPPPPPPVQAYPTDAAAAALAAAAMPAPPQKGGKLGIVLGAVAAIAVAIGVVVFFVLGRPGGETGELATADTSEARKKTSGTGDEGDESSTRRTSDDPSDESSSGDDPSEPGTEPATGNRTPYGVTPRTPTTTPTAQPTTGEPAEKDPADPPPEEPKEPAPAVSTPPTTPTPEPPGAAGAFSADAARTALNAAAGGASGCGKGEQSGRGRATVTFAPAGNAAGVSIDGPFSGSVKSCILSAFGSARVPPFKGSSQSVPKTFFVK